VGGFALLGRIGAALDAGRLLTVVLVVAWFALVAASIVTAIRARHSLANLTMALNASTAVLVGLTLSTIVPYELGRAAAIAADHGQTGSPAIAASRVPDRDIYLIVLDRYGSDWSIEHRFGIPGDGLTDWLATQGFQVYPGARANYRATDFSLGAMLSMRMLDEYSVTPGPDSADRTYARSRLERTEVASFLRRNGYTYYNIGSWWKPTHTNELADVNLVWNEDDEFAAVLRESTVMPIVDRVLGRGPDSEGVRLRDNARAATRYALRQLNRVAGAPGRKFVFAHILMPHTPYVLDAQGEMVTQADAARTPEWKLYRDHLTFIDGQMRSLMETLLAGPDEADPIIVLVGDEGPYLCAKDCVTDHPQRLGIRFGVLAAYYLPGMPAPYFPEDHTHVNTFRAIFSSYFGADLPPLPDRSFDWPDNEHVYDFSDVTDQLPLPGGANGPEGIEMPPVEGPESSAPPAGDIGESHDD
jgi:hypothetical protein